MATIYKKYDRKIYHWAFLILAAFSVNLQLYCQYQNLAFDHLIVDDGLSQSTIFTIAQDHKGFIWIGTRDGLNRYDSHKIKIYRNIPDDPTSLAHHTVNSILVDSKGRLWVGTNQGLCLYNSEKDNFTRIINSPGQSFSLSNIGINVIFEDKQKNIWIGTRNGLNVITTRHPDKIIQFYHDPKDPESLIDNAIHSIYQDRHGEMWVGTTNGLSAFKLKNAVGRLHCRHFPELCMLSNNWINTITEGENETIWIGSEKGGLYIYDPGTHTIYSGKNRGKDPMYQELFGKIDRAVRVINKDKDGKYWIGTLSGLLVFDPKQKQLRKFSSNPDNPSSLSDNSVRSIFIDRDGSQWIGTYYGGVNFHSAISNQFDHFRQTGRNSPLRFKMASAMYEDHQNNLWLSIDGGGVIFWNRKDNTFELYSHKSNDPASLCHNNVKCIYPDGHEGLWVGTFNGLSYFSFRTKKFTSYFYHPENSNTIPNDRVYDIKADRKGNFWIATNGGGLCRYNKKEDKFETIHQSDTNPNTPHLNFLTCLTFDSKDRLWIGTAQGLCVRYPDGRFRRFPDTGNERESLSTKFILFVYEDHHKHLWIGTRGNGLFSFHENTNSFSSLTVDDGLSGNNIFGICEDNHGCLWLSTENGITKFDPKNKRFKIYTRNDGLICKEFNFNSYMTDHSGLIYFGGYNGIVTFRPDSIVENTAVPPLAFTKLKLFANEVKINTHRGLLKQSIGETKSLTFHYDQNVFSLEFAVLNYINPKKNKYAYKLEGFEKSWNYVEEPVATYMNLKPGTYTFLAKGCNNDGVWNDSALRLEINVLPPLWKTWWAYTLYFIIILTALMSFVRMIRIRLKLEQNLYLEQMESKKQNELYQSKLRFFTNISHELRTPLTLIISPIETLINSIQEASIRKQLQIIQSNANRLLRLVNQLLDFRKQETGNLKLKVAEGNIIKFISEIKLAFQEYARIRNISFDFKSHSEEIKLWYDREELEKVLFNLLSNAFKFTPEGGKITISVLEYTPDKISDPGFIEIIVEDNGVGIPNAHLEKVFDRFYQVENSDLTNHGFGIGLALSKGIIELHHGTISAHCTEAINGKTGETKFIIKLWLGKDHFSEDNIIKDYKTSEQLDSYLSLENETPGFRSESTTSHSPRKDSLILIVEDNYEIRNYLKDRLTPLYTIKEARNGVEAWETATVTIPDLIISDVMMPYMDGITLVNHLKSDQRTNHIPVILITARNTIIHQMEGLETGADEYITKPFNIGVLELKIRNLLISRENLKQKYSRIITLEPKDEELTDPDEKFIWRLMGIIESQIAEPEFNVSKLVVEIGMSRPVLFRKIKALTNMSVIDLIKTTRLKKAAMLLKQKKITIAEVGYAVGFSDPKYFSKAFRMQYGKTPSEYMAEAEH